MLLHTSSPHPLPSLPTHPPLPTPTHPTHPAAAAAGTGYKALSALSDERIASEKGSSVAVAKKTN